METKKLIEALLCCMGRTDCRKCPILGQCNGTFDFALHLAVEHIKAQATENVTLRAQLAEKEGGLVSANKALRLSIATHSTDERQIARLVRHYLDEASGPEEAGEVEQC